MAHAPVKCSFAGIANVTCGPHAVKTIFFLLSKYLNRSLRYWQTTKMAHAPAKCSFAGIANITCGSAPDKDDFFLLNKCVVQVKNHLRSCNLSPTQVTEYDLILARVGKFNRSHEYGK